MKKNKQYKSIINKPITHDLFGIEECSFCDGSGEVEVENTKHAEETNECEMCKGTGVDT